MFHKQCKLQKDNTTYTCWIPESYAHVGKTISLKIDEIWIEGWEIAEVYNQTRVESKEIEIRSQDYKHQRKASDI